MPLTIGRMGAGHRRLSGSRLLRMPPMMRVIRCSARCGRLSPLPIDREDIYILSERCDRVVNAARDITAEADALGWVPDQHAATMAHHLREGVARLVEGFAALRANPDESGARASEAVQEVRAVENTYRSAMAELLEGDDLRVVFTTREFYRSYARAEGLVVAVADRLWYAVLSQV